MIRITPAGIPEEDWSSWPTGALKLIWVQQEEIQLSGGRMTNSATNSPPWRPRWRACARGLAAARATPPNLPPAMAPALCRQNNASTVAARAVAASTVAASAAASRGILDRGRSCCRSSGGCTDWCVPAVPTSTCATLPAEVEAGPYGPRLSALVGLLGSAFPPEFQQNPGVTRSASGSGDQSWGDRLHWNWRWPVTICR